MASEPKSERLPFEPRQNKKKKPEVKTSKAASVKKNLLRTSRRNTGGNANLSAIPDSVSKRMARRMALFCGIPSVLGMSSLFVFYWFSSQDILDLPPYIALIVSFGFLALGVLGLSYGIFSASWDEDRVGGLLGIEEFKINIGRTGQAWKESRKKPKGN